MGGRDSRDLLREAVRVRAFGEPPRVSRERSRGTTADEQLAVVRVTHASVGVTDAMAARGDYLLHPRPGFVTGYDFVGVIEQLPPQADPRNGVVVGRRVTGILPRMGAHASVIRVSPSLLVPVPDALDSATAATVPLDAVTAALALDALDLAAGSLLIQGAGGAVGAWATQFAHARGLDVYGTASERSRTYATRLGATVLDYRDPAWPDRLLAACPGGVSGAIDHTGDAAIRRLVRPEGRIVRTAFGGAPGRQRSATARGSLTAIGRRYARPRESVCSVPLLVATRRAEYRATLGAVLVATAAGALTPPRAQPFALQDIAAALRAAANAAPGTKIVLEMPGR